MSSSGKVAVITGASRGIGRAIALAFAREGYRLVLNFLKEKVLAEAVAQEILAIGNRDTLLFPGDVGDPAQVRKLMESAVVRWGRLDVIVNNAGITRDRTLLKMSDGEWNEVLRVNLSGTFWCLREAARIMTQQKGGAIVNIASLIGIRGGYGCANYAAAKAGVIALTKSAARELGRHNIRVNAVLPGFHLTDMGKSLPEDLVGQVQKEHALGRFASLEEVARLVLFLSEPTSISGQVYSCDSRVY